MRKLLGVGHRVRGDLVYNSKNLTSKMATRKKVPGKKDYGTVWGAWEVKLCNKLRKSTRSGYSPDQQKMITGGCAGSLNQSLAAMLRRSDPVTSLTVGGVSSGRRCLAARSGSCITPRTEGGLMSLMCRALCMMRSCSI
ncbi:hypothetical protein XENTR_v10023439 [Xenopus tropicalis]|nr:hypothetical protein XENTR_v10023439 [Xenopus tropicalis]